MPCTARGTALFHFLGKSLARTDPLWLPSTGPPVNRSMWRLAFNLAFVLALNTAFNTAIHTFCVLFPSSPVVVHHEAAQAARPAGVQAVLHPVHQLRVAGRQAHVCGSGKLKLDFE